MHFFKFRYNIYCHSKSITKCEQRHSELISCKITSTSNSTCLFNASRQNDSRIKKETVNGRKVVVQVDFIENYMSVTGTNNKSLCSLCVHRLIIAPLNPLSSPVMMWVWDMASLLSTAS